MKTQNIKVIKNEDKPETPEILAASLIKIADAFEQLSKQGISQNGLIALLKDMPGMTTIRKREIKTVLDNLKRLKSYYVRS